jgi:RNase P/RNase MRP subunit p29
MDAVTQNRTTLKAMRWPEIFFKTRNPKLTPAKETPPKAPAKMPSISELEKSVEPSAVKILADKTAAESLRALEQSDTIRVVPRGPAEAVPPAKDPAPRTTSSSTSDASPTGVTGFRRLTKLTDVARILPKSAALPSDAPANAPEMPSSAVVPPSFPVAGTAGNVIEIKPEKEVKFDSVPETRPIPQVDAPPDVVRFEKSEAPPESAQATTPLPIPANESPAKEPLLKDTTRVTLPGSAVTAVPPAEKTPPPSVALETVKPPSDLREKREFVLANGERILGHILSETAETIYLDHQTLGVLTLPRKQIAGKPIEVILINGDRVVGDLIAETSECLYIRHASLGMLTVPHNQRSTRVVEAILKDGDRILGEVLAETDQFTVIRSATLGTVAVQHEQVAMLNRKIEQTQLRALPPPSLEEQKPAILPGPTRETDRPA